MLRVRTLVRCVSTRSQAHPRNVTAIRRLSTTAATAKKAAKVLGYTAASAVLGVAGLTAVLFIHDAFTYTSRHVERVPVNPLALHPETGGPKNLPVVKVLVDDEEDDEMKRLAQKPRLVIVGGGWGAMGVLRNLSPGDYHVTIVSSETFTTFTPLLPSAAVGTVQVRSLVEPIRKLVARLRGHFIHGKAVDFVPRERLIEVETPDHGHVYLPYDKLVIAVGSVSSTHGVPGLEHSFQLKTISDAQSIRRRIMDNFELASLPTTTPEERKRLLSFVICGGGPTGVESAAEIYDFCQEDIFEYFPKICREEVSIHLIQSREHILNTYSEAISDYAENKFRRDNVDLITNARVNAITPESVMYTQRDPDTGGYMQHTIPANFVLWSTGIAMNPFTQRVCDVLPNQVHRKAIEVDAHLRVNGVKGKDVYAIGDCATIDRNIVQHLMDLVDASDKDRNGKIDFGEWEIMVKEIRKRVPMAEAHLAQVKGLFQMYDSDADDCLSLNELVRLLEAVGNKITSLPATAQVASQQGKYVGKKLHRCARVQERKALHMSTHPSAATPLSLLLPSAATHTSLGLGLDDDDDEELDAVLSDFAKPPPDEALMGPFRYFHLGSLAYIGNAAVFDFGKYSFMGGLAAMYAWRSVYWNEQVSWRTRALLMIDWVVRGIWGRDLSRL